MLNKITLPCVFGQKIQINNDIVIEIFEIDKQLKMSIIGANEVHRKDLYEISLMQQASTESNFAQGWPEKRKNI